MINYYLRPDKCLVKIDDSTKEIINVLNIPIQKTISKINNDSYYDSIISQVTSWQVSDENTYVTNYNEVLSLL
jgi:hypothetical protein